VTGEPAAAREQSGVAIQAWLAVYLKGVLMGAADAVPGVSGGTIALITGIYERLIAAVTALDLGLLALFGRAHTAEGRARLRAGLAEADVAFLAVLGTGVVTAVVTVSRVLELALTEARGLTFAFFFGLIAASAVVLYGQVALDSADRLVAAVAGFVVAFVLTDPSLGGALPNTLPVVFLGGVIAVSAMVLPGISGSFLLLLLGQYTFLIGSLTAFTDGLLALGSPELVAAATVVVTFVAGAAVGLLSVAHAVKWALEARRGATLAFLVSLMVGALRLPVVEVADATATWTPATAALTVGVAVVGGAAVLLADRYTDDIDYDVEPAP
jgi:putative membrane protein